MSNKNNDIIADKITDEVNKIPFVRETDRLEYASKWLKAVIESEQPDIFAVKPQVYTVKAMTDDELIRAENSFINSFSE